MASPPWIAASTSASSAAAFSACAAAAVRRQSLPQRFHQRAGAEDEIDRILLDRRRQFAVQLGRLIAKFQHVAEHRDPPAEMADRRLPEQRKRGAHRGRIGVVAFVDQGGRAARQVERDARAAAGGGRQDRRTRAPPAQDPRRQAWRRRAPRANSSPDGGPGAPSL